MPKSKPYYHIQILRALAVLMVIFFHLDKNLLPNGYLGVDVFFVISGLVSIYFFISLKEQISFYMPFTRAWEFLAGAIVFFIFNNKRTLQFKTKYLLPILVILLALLSYYGFTINKNILSTHLQHSFTSVFMAFSYYYIL